MRLTLQTDYALRLLMYLAVQGERRSSIREIADQYGISENHLMKVTQRLASLGYVDALRGRHGGPSVARFRDSSFRAQAMIALTTFP